MKVAVTLLPLLLSTLAPPPAAAQSGGIDLSVTAPTETDGADRLVRGLPWGSVPAAGAGMAWWHFFHDGLMLSAGRLPRAGFGRTLPDTPSGEAADLPVIGLGYTIDLGDGIGFAAGAGVLYDDTPRLTMQDGGPGPGSDPHGPHGPAMPQRARLVQAAASTMVPVFQAGFTFRF